MNQIARKLDRSSRILLLISAIGVVASLYSLYHVTSQSDEALDPKDRIAQVTIYNKDTRLKRSGSIHWFPVNQPLDCYSNDLVFTGKDSFATIQFSDGGKITLHPMSLISLSKGQVSLSSGTIEVDLKKGSPLSVESFGETFKLEENTKLKLENTETVKRIVPLAGTSPALEKDARFRDFLKPQTLTIATPASGQQVPKFNGKSIIFNWKASQPLKNDFYKLEFSTSKDFASLLHSVETTSTTALVPSAKLPVGLIHWRVGTVKGKVGSESSFYHSDKFRIDRLHPTDRAEYPLKEVLAKGLLFEWTNPLKSPQRIQISRTRDFSEVIQQGDLTGVQKVLKFELEGEFFWRVGYVLEGDSIHWSEAGAFAIKPDVVVAPLEIVDLPPVLDFAARESYLVKVRDLNNCDQFEFVLTRGDKVVFKTLSRSSELKVNKLRDGQYNLTVIGKQKDRYLTKPLITFFTVTTSPPLEAPKIKKKKVKLFVKLLRRALGLLLPAAHAAEKFYPLEWEAVEGATYEVEITYSSKKKPYLKKETKTNSFRFVVPGLQTYYWRVRAKKDSKWSPWSDYSVVEAEDKIKRVVPPLMESPGDGATVDIKEEDPSIVFKWQQPDPNFSYFLELSNRSDGKPIKVIPVTGDSYDLRLAKLPKEIYWRVYAKSKFENTSISAVRYVLRINKIKKVVAPPGLLRLTPRVLQSASTFSLDKKIAEPLELEESYGLAGQIGELNLEYLPGRWFHKRSFNLLLRFSSLAEGDNKLNDMRLGAEYGFLSDPEAALAHNFYLGYFVNYFKMEFGEKLDATFTLPFLSARYNFLKKLSENWTLDLSLTAQVPPSSFLPSAILRPGIEYRISPRFGVTVYALYERFVAKPKIESSDVDSAASTATIELQNIAAGAGVTVSF